MVATAAFEDDLLFWGFDDPLLLIVDISAAAGWDHAYVEAQVAEDVVRITSPYGRSHRFTVPVSAGVPLNVRGTASAAAYSNEAYCTGGSEAGLFISLGAHRPTGEIPSYFYTTGSGYRYGLSGQFADLPSDPPTTVPEPSSAALVAGAAIALTIARRRLHRAGPPPS